MFNIGGGELLVIMLLALIVLGPTRLPDAARQLGKAMSDLRRLSTGFQNEVRTAIDLSDDPKQVAARRNLLAKETRISATDAASSPAEARPVATAARPKKQAKPTKPTKKAPATTSSSAAATARPTQKKKKKKAPAKKAAKAAAKGTAATSAAKAAPRRPTR
jgi:sec-independent protein translocase protein TatB